MFRSVVVVAKKIKFALKMKDGAEVRNIEELREHFDIDIVVGYFLDGRLFRWLENFYYDTEADLVEKLDKNDVQLKKKLCEIFDVEYEDDGEFDVELAAKRRETLEKLKQYTADEKILALVDNVAFNRGDMVELLDEDADTIVLVDGTYRIPLREHDKKYIGVGNVVAEINSKEVVDFDEIGIQFENIRFDDEYLEVLNAVSSKDAENVNQVELFEDRLKKAEAGDVSMMYWVGCHYNFGTGVGKDDEKAFEWYMKAAKSGHASAMYSVALAYKSGSGVNRDIKKSFEWALEAAKNNDASGMCHVGDCYYNGAGVNKNQFEAVKWYTRAAEKNNTDAMEKLGYCYYNGTGVLQNLGEAIKWYKKGSDLSNGYCMCKLAECYRYGDGVSVDIDKAINLYNSAADSDDAFFCAPMRELGDIYRLEDGYIDHNKAIECYLKALELDCTDGKAMNAIGLLTDDDHKKFEWYKKAAEAGYPAGIHNLACCYYYGIGVDTNIELAKTLFEKSANEGRVSSMLNLGDIYSENDDGKNALIWYNKVLELGDDAQKAEAYLGCGLLYVRGAGVTKSDRMAFTDFKRAAELGQKWGMYNVARCYFNGVGTTVDVNKGFEWMRKAADVGIKEAVDFLKNQN